MVQHNERRDDGLWRGYIECLSGSDDEVSNLADYGRLYNWYAVDDARGLCPSGWHVPTDEEYTTLKWNWDERI